MATRDKDVPGVPSGMQPKEGRRGLARWGEVEGLDDLMGRWLDDGWVLVDLRFRAPSERSPEWLVVARCTAEGRKLVGFTNAPSFGDAVHLTLARLANGSMKWMEDKPYEK